ncbi:MAG TPA: hypothetical protein VNM15_00265 [Candidatus Binatia bacterium]|nr:hypothetical protein [Candidatus Binatia bacterium]
MEPWRRSALAASSKRSGPARSRLWRSYLGGAFYDWTGSYLASFMFSALLLALSDICIWIASVPAVGEYDKRLWGGAGK